MLELVYTGKEPLTNVVMYSLVQQDPKGNRGSQIPLEAIDAFNRTFGATNEQAEDAMSYLEAVEAFERMPKFACLYLPALHPGKDLMFEVGHMERGAILASNISRFAIYSDQGRILMVNTKDFPLKPEPVRQKPMGPVIGEQYSKPYPGKGDKVYVGSVWRGTSSSEEGATRTRVEKKWEIVVTARNATKIEMNAFEIDSQSKRPIRLVGTALPNGSMRIASIGHFVSLLPPGILNDDELIFSASPAGQKSNLRSASLRLKYVPPKEDVDNK